MTTPVWDSIELDTVGELHFVGLFKLAGLLRTLGFSFEVPFLGFLPLF